MKNKKIKICEGIMDKNTSKNTWMYCVQILKRVGRTSYISQLPVNLPEHQNIDNLSFDILIQVKCDFVFVEINLPLYTGNVEKHVHPGQIGCLGWYNFKNAKKFILAR